LNEGLKHIDKLFHEYKEKIKQTTFVILQSEVAPERLEKMGLRTMVTDFPVIRYPLG
jgi:DNA polymerase epsilon subunit 1